MKYNLVAQMKYCIFQKLAQMQYALFNNISVISWRSVLLVEETGVSGENLHPVGSHRHPLSYTEMYDVSSTLSYERGSNS